MKNEKPVLAGLFNGSHNNSWHYMLIAYAFYGLCLLLNSAIARQIGASILVITIIGVVLVKRRFIKHNITTFLSVLLLLSFLFSTFLNLDNIIPYLFIKRLLVLLILFLVALNINKPIMEFAYRRHFSYLILAVVCIGLLLYGSLNGRQSGAFAHPNVMAFTVMLALLFIDYSRDRLSAIVIHSMVIFLVLLTSSLATFLAYFIGLAYLACVKLSFKRLVTLALVMAIISPLIVYSALSIPLIHDKGKYLVERVEKQIVVLREGAAYALREGDFEHGKFARMGLSSETSALWRLGYWSRVTRDFIDSGFMNKMIGFGPGAVNKKHGMPPHNEIVRLIYEHGVLGFVILLVLLVYAVAKIPNRELSPYLSLAVIFLLSNPLDSVFGTSMIMACGISMVGCEPVK